MKNKYAPEVKQHTIRLAQEQRGQRCLKDEQLLPPIRNIWERSRQIYGARKVWEALVLKRGINLAQSGRFCVNISSSRKTIWH